MLKRKRRKVRSPLSELLDLVNGTGRRISAVCQLRYADLRLDDGPHGAIRWPEDTDKMGYEFTTPIGQDAIERVTFWGLSDRRTWRFGQHPLIFDSQNQRKPAYEAILDAVSHPNPEPETPR